MEELVLRVTKKKEQFLVEVHRVVELQYGFELDVLVRHDLLKWGHGEIELYREKDFSLKLVTLIWNDDNVANFVLSNSSKVLLHTGDVSVEDLDSGNTLRLEDRKYEEGIMDRINSLNKQEVE